MIRAEISIIKRSTPCKNRFYCSYKRKLLEYLFEMYKLLNWVTIRTD